MRIAIALERVLLALVANAAWSASGTLSADTYVAAANVSLNYGALGAMQVGPLAPSSAPGDTALLQFALTGLPAGTLASHIAKATLTVYLNRVATPGALDFAEVSTPWSETGVAFNSRPGTFPPFAMNVPAAAAGQFVTVDVTNLVKNWVAGTLPNHVIT